MTLKRPTRREFLKYSALSGVVGLAAYAGVIEPNELTTEHVRLVLPRLPDAFHGLRIAQLSDLHYGIFTPAHVVKRVVAHVNELKPDICAITGDFVTAPLTHGVRQRDYDQVDECAHILSGLQAPLGVFGCLGNHDVSVDPWGVTVRLEKNGVKVVRNSHRLVERDGARLWVGGVDDVLYARADLDVTFAKAQPDEFKILLAHEPDFADHAATYPIDLQLSGHSHGGQIRFPFVGALYYPQLARKYPNGRYLVRNMHLYTNRGIGEIFLPVRFLAPPEVTVFTLLNH